MDLQCFPKERGGVKNMIASKNLIRPGKRGGGGGGGATKGGVVSGGGVGDPSSECGGIVCYNLFS